MLHSIFDTLKFVQKLTAAGIPEREAIAISEAQTDVLAETMTLFATKTDILELRYEVKHEIAEMRQEFRLEVTEMRQEFRLEVTELRQEFRSEVTDLKSRLKIHGWMLGFILTGIVTIVFKSFFG